MELAELCLSYDEYKERMMPDFEQLTDYTTAFIKEVARKEQCSDFGRLCMEEACAAFYYPVVALVAGEHVYGSAWTAAIVSKIRAASLIEEMGLAASAQVQMGDDDTVRLVFQKKEQTEPKEEGSYLESVDALVQHLRKSRRTPRSGGTDD